MSKSKKKRSKRKIKTRKHEQKPNVSLESIIETLGDDYFNLVEVFSHMPCIICGGDNYTVAHFIPDNPEDYGGKKGVPRLCLVPLCETCFESAKQNEKIVENAAKKLLVQFPFMDRQKNPDRKQAEEVDDIYSVFLKEKKRRVSAD